MQDFDLLNVEKMPVHENVITKIKLNSEYEYDVTMDVYLTKGDEFYIDIAFEYLTLKDIEILNNLDREIVVNIESPFFKAQEYDIRQIAIVEMKYNEPKLKLKCYTNPKGEKNWVIN